MEEPVAPEAPQEQVAEKPKEYTVEIIKANKPRKTLVREIPIEWEGKPASVIIKKMTYGERAEYIEKFMNIQVHGNYQNVNISFAAMQIQAILLATHEAPFPLNEDYVKHELDGEIGELVYKEIEDFNKLNTSAKKNSDGPSSTEPKTQNSTESSTTSD